MLLVGSICTCVSMIGFGVVGWIDNVGLFVFLSFFFRLMGGVGSGSLHVASYSMVALEYPDSLT